MAGGVVLPGLGEKVSAEEISTLNGGALDPVEKVQRLGVALLADGEAIDVSTGDPLPVLAQGEVEVMFSLMGTPTNVTDSVPLPVVQTGTPDLPTGAATEAKQDTIIGHVDGIEGVLGTIDADTGAMVTALQIMDDWDESDRAKVNPIAGQAGVQGGSGTVNALTQRVVLATDVTPPLPSGAATAANQATIAGHLDGVEGLLGTIDADTSLLTTAKTPFKLLDVDETEDQVKGSAGRLYTLTVFNLATARRFLKIYDGTAAGVTVGTTTPIMTIPLAGVTSPDVFGVVVALPQDGLPFATGITFAATTGLADNDTGAPGASEIVVNGVYS